MPYVNLSISKVKPQALIPNSQQQCIVDVGVPLRLEVKYGTTWDESKRAMNLNQTSPRASRALNH